MITKELIDFIRKSEIDGQTTEQIKDVLLKNGWTPKDVEEGFLSANPKNSEASSSVLPNANVNVSLKKGLKIIPILAVLFFVLAIGVFAYFEKDNLKNLPVLKMFFPVEKIVEQIPENADTTLPENNVIKDEMGRQLFLNKGKIIEVMGYNEDENNDPFAILKMKDQTYYIEKNNFYWINWRFDPANKKEESMKQIFGFNQFIIENRRWKKEYLTNLQDILSHKIDHAEEILSLSDLDPEGAIILLRELDTDYSNELADEIDKLLNMWGEFDVESEIELSKLN